MTRAEGGTRILSDPMGRDTSPRPACSQCLKEQPLPSGRPLCLCLSLGRSLYLLPSLCTEPPDPKFPGWTPAVYFFLSAPRLSLHAPSCPRPLLPSGTHRTKFLWKKQALRDIRLAPLNPSPHSSQCDCVLSQWLPRSHRSGKGSGISVSLLLVGRLRPRCPKMCFWPIVIIRAPCRGHGVGFLQQF